MEFETEADLCEFLAGWLEAHGHNIYRQVKCPEGGKIDILTQEYAIACCHRLTPETLLASIDNLAACGPHVAQQRSVIAGLDSSVEDLNFDTVEGGVSLGDAVAQAGIAGMEVWFVDQIETLQDYYQQQTAAGAEASLEEPIHAPPLYGKKPRSHWNPWAGVSVALGMASILAVSFTLAYRILQEPTTARFSPEQQAAWDKLHGAVAVWDMQTAQEALQGLQRGSNPCGAKFANRLQSGLDSQGAEGFREINSIKRALNEQEGCNLEIIVYDFAP
ncbi:hypothetical protein C7271_15380 [filamentous cyanobacterium CCP5]|nr:hypothetical protein C7271_15380 [filamentous cyanobacterium CCP5]